MKIAILGFDRQGRSAYEYWVDEKNEITICDQKPDLKDIPPEAKVKLGKKYLDNLGDFDLLVRTPGLHPQKIIEANLGDNEIIEKITTVTNEFFRVCPTKNIIGVTGTKGKGTTSTLIAEMLHTAGKRVHLGGNIGIPPLDLLNGKGVLHQSVTRVDQQKSSIRKDDWVVLELANYQLIDLHYSPRIAVGLMITPEHLDWHESFDEYLRAKQQLFVHQTENDTAIYKADDNRSMQLAASGHASQIPYLKKPGGYVKNGSIFVADTKICSTKSVPLLGEHNLENVCAAATAVWQVIKDPEAIKHGIQNVKSLLHLLEQVAEKNGVAFYSDSLGTTPETAIAAIKAITRPTIIILGGSDKGADYDLLAQEIADSKTVKHVVLIGKTGPVIERALEKINYEKITYGGDTMAAVVKTAYGLAESGDTVLLSPACASFDMFADYVDRGEQFIQAAKALD